MLNRDLIRRGSGGKITRAVVESLEGRTHFSQTAGAPATDSPASVYNASAQSQFLRTLNRFLINWDSATPISGVDTGNDTGSPASAPSPAPTPTPTPPPPPLPTIDLDQSIPASLPGLSFVAPESNPALPAGMNSFAPPTGTQPVASGSPIIGASNQTAAPDQSIVLTGNQFTSFTGSSAYSDTRVLVYGQTNSTDGTFKDAQLQDLTTNGLTATIDASEPANSMYFVWAINSHGVSTPVAINQTQAWWIGTPGETVQTAPGTTTISTSVGQTMSVYGKNLSNGASTPQSWVYLQPTDGSAGQWAQVTSVNPYQVSFTASTAGTYQVWVNNGLGGQYGWSEVTQNGAPVVLNVAAAASTWSNDPASTINVTNYGAVGDGKTDDGQALLNAIAALQPGDTLYFPAGTFLVSSGEELTLPLGVRVMGAGTGQTTLLFTGAINAAKFNYGVPFDIGWVDGGARNVEMDSMTIEHTGPSINGQLVLARNGYNVVLNDVNLIANADDALRVDGSYGVTVENSNIQGMGISWLWVHDAFITNTNFQMAYDGEAAIYGGGNFDTAITGDNVQNFDNTTTDMSGSGQGRFIEYNTDFGSAYYQYVAGNSTLLAAPIAGNYGEQINIEGSTAQAIYGAPTSVSGNTLTFSSASMLANSVGVGEFVEVNTGPGMGEIRFVTAAHYTLNPDGTNASVTVTINQPFNVTPNSTSQIYVGNTAYDSAFYQNTFADVSGASGAASNLPAATGLDVYSGAYGLEFDSNTTQSLNSGVTLTGGGTVQPIFFDEIVNNNFQNTLGLGSVTLGGSSGNDLANNYPGTIVRGNTMTSVNAGVELNWQNVGSDLLTVIESNSITGPIGVDTLNNPNVLVRENNFIASANANEPLQTPQAVVYGDSSSPTVLLRDNVYQGYSDSLPYAIKNNSDSMADPALGAPYNAVFVTVAANFQGQLSLPLWDNGPASLSWTGTTGASWLSFQTNSGTLSAQDATGSAPVVVDTTGLSAGAYHSTVTISYQVGGVTTNKVFTVYLTVQ